VDWLWNIFRKWQQKRARQQFIKCIQDEIAESFLELILKLMSLAFKLDRGYRKNIEGFTGKYQFRSVDNSVTVAAIFNGKALKVKEALIPDADVSVIFKDGQALMNYLLAQDRDILKMVLNNEVILKGNLNYMMKFGYMANHLQLALTGRLP
jgi:hypothetical protein